MLQSGPRLDLTKLLTRRSRGSAARCSSYSESDDGTRMVYSFVILYRVVSSSDSPPKNHNHQQERSLLQVQSSIPLPCSRRRRGWKRCRTATCFHLGESSHEHGKEDHPTHLTGRTDHHLRSMECTGTSARDRIPCPVAESRLDRADRRPTSSHHAFHRHLCRPPRSRPRRRPRYLHDNRRCSPSHWCPVRLHLYLLVHCSGRPNLWMRGVHVRSLPSIFPYHR